jgi:hypothetical protein
VDSTLLGGAIIGFLVFLLMLLQHFMLQHRRRQLRERKQRMHDIRYKQYDALDD